MLGIAPGQLGPEASMLTIVLPLSHSSRFSTESTEFHFNKPIVIPSNGNVGCCLFFQSANKSILFGRQKGVDQPTAQDHSNDLCFVPDTMDVFHNDKLPIASTCRFSFACGIWQSPVNAWNISNATSNPLFLTLYNAIIGCHTFPFYLSGGGGLDFLSRNITWPYGGVEKIPTK